LHVTVFRGKEFFIKTTLPSYLPEQSLEDTVIIKFNGEINYLNSENYINQIKKIKKCHRIILSFAQLSDMDIDAIEALENVLEYFKRKKTNIILTGLNNP
jgi:anti-anti-sigma regulatory factor